MDDKERNRALRAAAEALINKAILGDPEALHALLIETLDFLRSIRLSGVKLDYERMLHGNGGVILAASFGEEAMILHLVDRTPEMLNTVKKQSPQAEVRVIQRGPDSKQ